MDDEQRVVVGEEMTARLAPRRDRLDDDVDEVPEGRLSITTCTLCY